MKYSIQLIVTKRTNGIGAIIAILIASLAISKNRRIISAILYIGTIGFWKSHIGKAKCELSTCSVWCKCQKDGKYH